MPIIFCNIGWMERYEGQGSGDAIKGGGSYVKQNEMGHEIYNFLNNDGILYGYVQINGKQINLERINPNCQRDFIDGVTVVWTATTPKVGGTKIIGWYKNATVYRYMQKFGTTSSVQSKNGIEGYWIKAPADKATLLSIDARIFEIPRRVKGGMGQSPIFYADSIEAEPLKRKVKYLIENDLKPTEKKQSRTQDQEKKAAVEKAAIHSCCSYYENLGYEVESVEKDNIGWDLEATAGKSLLRIEVKGLSGNIFSIELTPNEYSAFTEKASDYRLAVVINALENPLLSICRYSNEQNDWIIENENNSSLQIQIKQSAIISRI